LKSVVESLCQRGASLDARDSSNEPPVWQALSIGVYEVADVLVGLFIAVVVALALLLLLFLLLGPVVCMQCIDAANFYECCMVCVCLSVEQSVNIVLCFGVTTPLVQC